MCWYFNKNSDLLFNMFTSSRFLFIKAFSLRPTIVYRADVTNSKTDEHKITMVSQILYSKNVMKIIKHLPDIDQT